MVFVLSFAVAYQYRDAWVWDRRRWHCGLRWREPVGEPDRAKFLMQLSHSEMT